MNINNPLYELADFARIKEAIDKGDGPVGITGCVESQKLHLINSLSDGTKTRVIVTFDELRARKIYEEYQFYDKNCVLYPAKDLIFFQADIHGNTLVSKRIEAWKKLLDSSDITIITTFPAFMTPVKLWTEDDVIFLEEGGVLEERALMKKLTELGYERTSLVQSKGQFSIRGDIVDIFDLTEDNPYRIELWGDEISSIRSFDALSQRSIESLKSVFIYPASELVLSKKRIEKGLAKIEKEAEERVKKLASENIEASHRLKIQIDELKDNITYLEGKVNLESYINYFFDDAVSFIEQILDYSNGKAVFFFDEPKRIRENANIVFDEFKDSFTARVEKGYALPGQLSLMDSFERTVAKIPEENIVSLSFAIEDARSAVFKPKLSTNVRVNSVSSYLGDFAQLVGDLKKYIKNKYRIILLSGQRSRAARLAEDLRDNGVNAFFSEREDAECQPGQVLVAYGHIEKGFEYSDIRFVVISESDIFGRLKKKKKAHKKNSNPIDFNELKIGDYIIHESHGIGVYKGIEKVDVEGIIKDYLKITYKDGANLYVPATGLDVVQKYASGDAKAVKVNKLGTKEWENTKRKVKEGVEEIAEDLVNLYASRQNQKGFQFSEDSVWQTEFEETFPFTETDDQMNAIAATKADMESARIMDRLICGDVGYGKTEVALRAAFKAVGDSKQVVLLAPTTILAQQHYNTFCQRMKDFPVRVDLMCRFKTPSEQKKTIQDLKAGIVDILIGTHRVLSDDVQFKDLGLLIVDEEQRFGVAHKEKLKKLKENVDVMALSATPIPRTLHMSLSGIRDMSVLAEPPQDRMPVETFVCEYNEELVREAITREVSRGGQVYYVYNRVANIADIAAKVQELVPDVNVAFAHGKMSERELERMMVDFVNGEIDVLVSTTIIETGLDIPNANTIIIHDSENLGLSQLYQLRGRVGRSTRLAYAFLMYKRDKVLKEIAEKRLETIKEFTDLGSGYKVAMRDLEIRGAGNLLGMSQSGHMAAVGYELYCKLLNEAVSKKKGAEVISDFVTLIELDVDAFIPPEYIVNETQKLDIYKRIAGVSDISEKEDLIDELKDRFATVPKSVDNLLRISLLRGIAHNLYITNIKGVAGKIVFTFKNDAKINILGFPSIIQNYKGAMKLERNKEVSLILKFEKSGIVEKDAEELMANTEEALFMMKHYLLSL